MDMNPHRTCPTHVVRKAGRVPGTDQHRTVQPTQSARETALSSTLRELVPTLALQDRPTAARWAHVSEGPRTLYVTPAEATPDGTKAIQDALTGADSRTAGHLQPGFIAVCTASLPPRGTLQVHGLA